MKLFTNEVFELRIPCLECSWKNLKKRSEISQNVKDVIIKYHKSFMHKINLRNFNTHRAHNIDKSSILLSALLLLQENDKLFTHQLEPEIEKFRSEKVESIIYEKKIAKQYVNAFMCSIIDEIIKRANNMKTE